MVELTEIESMDVLEAVASRYSCRAFLPTPVPEKTVREIVERAARAPSAGNMQPWRVYAIAGQQVEELKALLAPRMATELPKGEGTAYTIYPEPLGEPYRARRFTVGELLYQSINVSREDKSSRYKQYSRNYQFFGDWRFSPIEGPPGYYRLFPDRASGNRSIRKAQPSD